MNPRVYLLVLVLIAAARPLAAKGNYSRFATLLSMTCENERACPPVLVPSPDGVKVLRRVFNRDREVQEFLPSVEVITSSNRWEIPVPGTWSDADVLWSPDARFLALTGSPTGNTNATLVYEITSSGPVPLDAIREPSQEMLRRFPPCRARGADPDACSRLHEGDDFNFATVAWEDAHTLVVMGEVPCSSFWGGIMCQVMGYEVNLPSGAIVGVMSAREFKSKWRHAMPFRLRVPGPPEWLN